MKRSPVALRCANPVSWPPRNLGNGGCGWSRLLQRWQREAWEQAGIHVVLHHGIGQHHIPLAQGWIAAPATPVNTSMLGSLASRRVAARAALTLPQPLQARLRRTVLSRSPVDSQVAVVAALRSFRWLRSEPISSGMAPSKPICSGCVMVS